MKKIFLLFFIISNTIFADNNIKKQDIELYYNVAVEKYVQNDYEKTIEYMEKIYLISQEQKYKNFIVKVLYEAANKEYMIRNYSKAFEYLEKSKKYTQTDERINQLKVVLQDLLSKQQQEVKMLKSKFVSEQKPEEKVSDDIKKETKSLEKKVVANPISEKVKPEVVPEKEEKNFSVKNNKNIYVWIIIIQLLIFLILSTIIFFIKLTNQKLNNTIKNYEIKISLLEKEKIKLQQTNLDLLSKVEKYKENEDLYKKNLDDYKNEIKEKMEQINLLQKQLIDLTSKPKMVSYGIDNFLQKKHKEIIGYITENPKEEQSEFDIEASRSRIALMLKNLYELNPSKALESIVNLATNKNPMIRINIVQGLIEIATEETFNILLNLYSDPDERVRREVIKRLWILKQKIDNNAIVLNDNIKSKVIEIVQYEKRKGEWIF